MGNSILNKFFFYVVMEFWSIGIDIELVPNCINPMERIESTNTLHILFVDDMLVFAKAISNQQILLMSCSKSLRLFTCFTGNKQKSKVFFSKRCRDKLDIANVLGIPLGSLHIKYFGLPLSISYLKPRHFS